MAYKNEAASGCIPQMAPLNYNNTYRQGCSNALAKDPVDCRNFGTTICCWPTVVTRRVAWLIRVPLSLIKDHSPEPGISVQDSTCVVLLMSTARDTFMNN